MKNLYSEAKKLAKLALENGSPDMQEQAKALLELLKDKSLCNQNAINYLKDNYDMQNGYNTCYGENELVAKIAGINLAHEIIEEPEVEVDFSNEEIIAKCIEVGEDYFRSRVTRKDFSDFRQYAKRQDFMLNKIIDY